MRRFIVGGGTMLLTFALGLAVNSLVNDFGFVVERWIDIPDPVLEEPYPAVPSEQDEVDLSGMHCGLLLVEINLNQGRSHSFLWRSQRPN